MTLHFCGTLAAVRSFTALPVVGKTVINRALTHGRSSRTYVQK